MIKLFTLSNLSLNIALNVLVSGLKIDFIGNILSKLIFEFKTLLQIKKILYIHQHIIKGLIISKLDLRRKNNF